MKDIGFVGVGNIGAPMAMRLVQAGLRLTVCDRYASSLEKFKALEVSTTQRPGDCAGADMVIIMVANDSQVEETVLGPDGLLRAIRPGRSPLLAIMSTVLPSTIKRLIPHCREKNVRLMDAPVSGMAVAAEQGKLTIMAGGDKTDLDSMRSVFEIMGENIYHTGALGTGEVTKLLNNMIFLTTFFVSSEAFQVGLKMGMDSYTLASIFENSSGRNILTKNWDNGRKIFAGFSESPEVCRGIVELARKDLGHAHQLAEEAGVPCTFLDHIMQGIQNLPYEEIDEKWQSISK